MTTCPECKSGIALVMRNPLKISGIDPSIIKKVQKEGGSCFA